MAVPARQPHIYFPTNQKRWSPTRAAGDRNDYGQVEQARSRVWRSPSEVTEDRNTTAQANALTSLAVAVALRAAEDRNGYRVYVASAPKDGGRPPGNIASASCPHASVMRRSSSGAAKDHN